MVFNFHSRCWLFILLEKLVHCLSCSQTLANSLTHGSSFFLLSSLVFKLFLLTRYPLFPSLGFYFNQVSVTQLLQLIFIAWAFLLEGVAQANTISLIVITIIINDVRLHSLFLFLSFFFSILFVFYGRFSIQKELLLQAIFFYQQNSLITN